jgi:hypothetical protein
MSERYARREEEPDRLVMGPQPGKRMILPYSLLKRVLKNTAMKMFFVFIYCLIPGTGPFIFSPKITPEFHTVNFLEASKRRDILYDKTEGSHSLTRYYKEKNLPPDLRMLLKKKYSQKKIYGVIEILNSAGLEYYIKMEDSRALIRIKMKNNENSGLINKYRNPLCISGK